MGRGATNRSYPLLLAKKKCMLRKHVLPHYTQDQFEDMECTSTQLQAFVISYLYEWSFVSGLTDSNSIHSFIDSIHMYIVLHL